VIVGAPRKFFCVLMCDSIKLCWYSLVHWESDNLFCVPIIFFLSVTECINFFNSQVNWLLGPIIGMNRQRMALKMIMLLRGFQNFVTIMAQTTNTTRAIASLNDITLLEQHPLVDSEINNTLKCCLHSSTTNTYVVLLWFCCILWNTPCCSHNSESEQSSNQLIFLSFFLQIESNRIIEFHNNNHGPSKGIHSHRRSQWW